MNDEAPVEFAALCLAPAFDETVAPGGAPSSNGFPGGKGPNVARWLESFLAGSGQTLLWLEAIWKTFNRWLASINSEAFEELTPLLRRAFADFSAPEKKQMGKIVSGLKLAGEPSENAPEATENAATSQNGSIPPENDLGPTLYPVLSFILGLDENDAKENAEARVLSFLSGNSEVDQ